MPYLYHRLVTIIENAGTGFLTQIKKMTKLVIFTRAYKTWEIFRKNLTSWYCNHCNELL